MTTETQYSYRELANAIRALAIDAVEQSKSGHPGMPMGMADVATVLAAKHLRFYPPDANWANRDRFILSAGHGSMLLYAMLYLLGYPDITIDDIKQFRQLHSKTTGHPEHGLLAGVETTTGPLGQGLANAVGIALAERIRNTQTAGAIEHHTYVIAGDGCLMEGISHEAASLAGHLQLGKLIVLWDDNHISIDGPTDLTVSEDTLQRFAAYGWHTARVDGHDPVAIDAALTLAKAQAKPVMLACRTTIGYGAPKKAGTSASHGSPLGAAEAEGAKQALGWSAPPFVIPPELLQAWRQIGARHTSAYQQTPSAQLPTEGDWRAALAELRAQLIANPLEEATRVSSGNVIKALLPAMPGLIGGSADLTGSNSTKNALHKPITSADYAGNYIYYGVREHAMAAIMNGLALYGGFVPYGGTFLVFSDYCRAAIRLSALMRQRVIHIGTHDSIGVGEDGPTHQPIEHLVSLRAIPHLKVYRPADALETLECWEMALETAGPSLLALTRQNVPCVYKLRREQSTNLSKHGGYVLAEVASGLSHTVTIVATGSEVGIAVAAHQLLAAEQIGARVVSMPCVEQFLAQPAEYKQATLGAAECKVVVEAASSLGWERVVGCEAIMICIDDFGHSAPAEQIYNLVGITPENIVAKVKSDLAKRSNSARSN